jgi:hypothetical protein
MERYAVKSQRAFVWEVYLLTHSETLLSHLVLRTHLNVRRNQGFPMNYPGPLEEREEVSANVCYVFAKSLPS